MDGRRLATAGSAMVLVMAGLPLAAATSASAVDLSEGCSFLNSGGLNGLSGGTLAGGGYPFDAGETITVTTSRPSTGEPTSAAFQAPFGHDLITLSPYGTQAYTLLTDATFDDLAVVVNNTANSAANQVTWHISCAYTGVSTSPSGDPEHGTDHESDSEHANGHGDHHGGEAGEQGRHQHRGD